jgi:hypothetical protein
MSCPEDYWRCVVKLRRSTAGLRDGLRKDRQVWAEDPVGYVRTTTRRIKSGQNTAIKDAVDVGTSVLTAVSPDPASATGAAIAKLLALGASSQRVRRAYWRIFRPELQVLFDLKSQALRLSELATRVGAIWASDLDQAELEHLAGVQSPAFLKLGDLERLDGAAS